jgi:hypothetical protein
LRQFCCDTVSVFRSFRAEHFPDSSPYPGLDEPDAFGRIDRAVPLLGGEWVRHSGIDDSALGKADVLIWHANLLHGGSMRRDLRLSRKAVVCHFFGKGGSSV